eukprot:TRINITY_DN293_c0_g1_i1.p1 TRINITY_DN293_c0_g1~~TRINITY_DN293_c0_g1_i1.p1  ORF type:complete len:1282 (+),score=271.02 TRINITY_DN293_c0_g1_i1:340-4185(+)
MSDILLFTASSTHTTHTSKLTTVTSTSDILWFSTPSSTHTSTSTTFTSTSDISWFSTPSSTHTSTSSTFTSTSDILWFSTPSSTHTSTSTTSTSMSDIPLLSTSSSTHTPTSSRDSTTMTATLTSSMLTLTTSFGSGTPTAMESTSNAIFHNPPSTLTTLRTSTTAQDKVPTLIRTITATSSEIAARTNTATISTTSSAGNTLSQVSSASTSFASSTSAQDTVMTSRSSESNTETMTAVTDATQGPKATSTVTSTITTVIVFMNNALSTASSTRTETALPSSSTFRAASARVPESTTASMTLPSYSLAALKQMSAAAAESLIQDEQDIAKKLMQHMQQVQATGKPEPAVSKAQTSDGSELTVVVLMPEAKEARRDGMNVAIDEASGSSVKVPQAVLHQLGSGLVALTTGPLSDSTAQLLASTSYETEGASTSLVAAPVSLSLFNASGIALTVELAEPILITLHGEADENVECVFWDRQKSSWSTEGVQRVEVSDSGPGSGSDVITCSTSHLSIFAAVHRGAKKYQRLADHILDCERGSFSPALGSNTSWWHQVPSGALWLSLVFCASAASLAAFMDAKPGQWDWMQEVLAASEASAVLQTSQDFEKQQHGSRRKRQLQDRVLTHCIRYLHAFRAGVDLDTLAVSMQLAQDQHGSNDDETPLRRAALQLAESVDLFGSATRAVCSFTGGNYFARALLLIPALHPCARLFTRSLFAPRCAHVAAFAAKLVGPMALNVFTLHLFGGHLRQPKQTGCEYQAALVMPLLAGFVSCLLGEAVASCMQALRRYNLPWHGEAAHEEYLRVRRWMDKTGVFWVLMSTYLVSSVATIAVFLASVPEEDGVVWLYGTLINVAFQMALLPLLMALVLASFSMCMQTCSEEKTSSSKHVQVKVHPADGRKHEDYKAAWPDRHGPEHPAAVQAAEGTPWQVAAGPLQNTSILVDYFAETQPSPSCRARPVLALSCWPGASDQGFYATRCSSTQTRFETTQQNVAPRPGTPRAFEATARIFPSGSHAVGVDVLTRPSTPMCPELKRLASGLKGCKWRSDTGSFSDLDLESLGEELGLHMHELAAIERPSGAKPGRRRRPESCDEVPAEDQDWNIACSAALDQLGELCAIRPPARQSPNANKGDEGLGPLGELLSMSTADAFGKTVSWSRRVESNLESIEESQDLWPQQPFHFHGDIVDDGAEGCGFVAIDPGSSMVSPDGLHAMFPDREGCYAAYADSRDVFERSAWAWARPPQVPDPFGTRSSIDSRASDEVADDPLLALSIRQEWKACCTSGSY